MKDSFGRKINYLRVSLTDRCNLRCSYCMPEEGISNKIRHQDMLSLEENFEIIKAFHDLGINKIRFTGGEPLVRKGISGLIDRVSKLENMQDISMTTNGILLKAMGQELKEAGLKRVNISLDTLNKDKYSQITRGGNLDHVLAGIEEAKRLGLSPIKINTVLIGGFNHDEIQDLVILTRQGLDVRFIELMPIGQGANFAEENFISNRKILDSIKDLVPVAGEDISSPARYYKLPGAKGKVGLINPISCKFCQNCNRLRLTATGMLKLCLHSNREIDLGTALRQGKDLGQIIKSSVLTKEANHELEYKKYIERNMNEIGG